MTEIDVTPILHADVKRMSASQAELGANAGSITWNNCLAFAAKHPIVTDENRHDVRKHFASYGAWDTHQILSWPDVQLAAMVWQEAAADMRHFREHCKGDFARYQTDCEQGRPASPAVSCSTSRPPPSTRGADMNENLDSLTESVVENGKSILAATLVVQGPADRPHRVVLRYWKGEFVTHLECLKRTPVRFEVNEHEDLVFEHDGYMYGHYFGQDLDKAMTNFQERAAKLLSTLTRKGE